MEADVETLRVALRAIYAAADAEVAGESGLFCEMSSRCCHFAAAGHELFLTALEFGEMEARGGAKEADPATCPWLVDGLCANREGRALACRTYFCSDEALAAEVTERWHAAIRALHQESGLRYEYKKLRDHML